MEGCVPSQINIYCKSTARGGADWSRSLFMCELFLALILSFLRLSTGGWYHAVVTK